MRQVLALVVVTAFVAPVAADEGMWTFDHFPGTFVRERYGVNIDSGWLERLQRASVRIEGGCTGSFVSANGLVLTNHHCVTDCLGRISRPDRDVLGAGFMAASSAAEERCAAEQVSVLTRMQDVTGVVAQSVGDGAGAAANERRKAALTRLEKECEDGYRGRSDPHSCEAVSLYGGGQYFLYHYKRYTDVRLVFAPEADVAFFGGDIDNFEFPRWNLDFALLRVYEDGKAAATPAYLRWRRGGASAGEAVFVAGHPGSTQRLATAAQLRFERHPVLSQWLLRAAELRGRYLQFAALGEEPARIVQEPLFGLENALKVRRNQMIALLDESFLDDRRDTDRALRRAIAANAAVAADASAFDDIVGALARYRAIYERHVFLEQGAALQGELANYARVLVRVAAERAKPNEQRQRGYTDTALPLLRQQVLAQQPVYRELETLRLGYSLAKLAEFLGIDDPAVNLALGGEAPQALAARLIGATRLGDAAFRERLWEGGAAALEAADDPLIDLARRLEPEAQKVRRQYEEGVESPLLAAEERLARARFAIRGTSTYPDATFTLRLSFGAVRGWREGERDVAPFTTLEGLFARATGQPPFELPERWMRARDGLNLDTRFNFVTDNDITGGNSGSPVVDSQGRLVGLIFDGNIHSIAGDYRFDPQLNRAVAVHPAIMVLALDEVYDAGHLLRELTIE
ncbi:MAG: S46 family peptidase [Gammaproteobacteria bacterium]|nr:MAG: S46 family peptidase [Gammaproteobacteria bacterium]